MYERLNYQYKINYKYINNKKVGKKDRKKLIILLNNNQIIRLYPIVKLKIKLLIKLGIKIKN